MVQWPAEEQQAAEAAARVQEEEALRQAASTGAVVFEGKPPRGAHYGVEPLGGFERVDPLLVVNGRAVWRDASGMDRYAYFFSGSHKWIIGTKASMHAGKGGGCVESAGAELDALTPDRVKGGWLVWTGKAGAWAEAPSIRVRQVGHGTWCHGGD